VELGVGATMYLCRIPLRRSVSSISLRLSKRAGTSTASSPAKWSMVRTSATEQSRFDHNLKTPRKKIFIQMSIFSQCCFWFIFCSVHVLTLVSTLFCPSVLFLSRCITVHDGVCLILMAFGWAIVCTTNGVCSDGLLRYYYCIDFGFLLLVTAAITIVITSFADGGGARSRLPPVRSVRRQLLVFLRVLPTFVGN
jgi:hypothetical protein